MTHVVPVACPECSMPCSESVVNGICTVCEFDVATWQRDPANDWPRQNLQILVDLVHECRETGKSIGYPAARHYPRHQAIRSIGEQLHAVGGQKAMARMLQLLEAEIGRYDDGDWASCGFVSFCWDGIGTWRP